MHIMSADAQAWTWSKYNFLSFKRKYSLSDAKLSSDYSQIIQKIPLLHSLMLRAFQVLTEAHHQKREHVLICMCLWSHSATEEENLLRFVPLPNCCVSPSTLSSAVCRKKLAAKTYISVKLLALMCFPDQGKKNTTVLMIIVAHRSAHSRSVVSVKWQNNYTQGCVALSQWVREW